MKNDEPLSDLPAGGKNLTPAPNLPAGDLAHAAQNDLNMLGNLRADLFSVSRAERDQMIRSARESIRDLQQRGKLSIQRAMQEKRRQNIAVQLCNGDFEEADRIIASGGPSFKQRLRMFRWRMTHR